MVARALSILVSTGNPGDADQLRSALGQNHHSIFLTPLAKVLSVLESGEEFDCLLLKVVSRSADELQVIPQVKRISPELPILAFGENWQVSNVVQAIRVGADEVCDFPSEFDELKKSIRRLVSANHRYTTLYSDLIPKSMLKRLSSEEARILHLLVQGRTTKEVGATLDISIRTVHYRKKELLRKLGVQNRSEAIELIRLTTGNLFGGI